MRTIEQIFLTILNQIIKACPEGKYKLMVILHDPETSYTTGFHNCCSGCAVTLLEHGLDLFTDKYETDVMFDEAVPPPKDKRH